MVRSSGSLQEGKGCEERNSRNLENQIKIYVEVTLTKTATDGGKCNRRVRSRFVRQKTRKRNLTQVKKKGGQMIEGLKTQSR